MKCSVACEHYEVIQLSTGLKVSCRMREKEIKYIPKNTRHNCYLFKKKNDGKYQPIL